MIAVITTIQAPTASVRRLVERLQKCDSDLVVAGDKKGPPSFSMPRTIFLSLQDQIDSPFRLARVLPTGHYTRKNIGYLHAMQKRVACIYETDDDNTPNETWTPRELRTIVRKVGERRWANVYRMFSNAMISPRGFPLDLLFDPRSYDLPCSTDFPVGRGRFHQLLSMSLSSCCPYHPAEVTCRVGQFAPCHAAFARP